MIFLDNENGHGSPDYGFLLWVLTACIIVLGAVLWGGVELVKWLLR